MSILDRYILKEFIKIFVISLLGLLVVYLAIDFLGKIRSFMEHDAKLIVMLEYFLLKLPKVIFLISPPALLIAILITFGILSRNNEIVAMEGSGISIYRISAPLLLFSLFYSFLLLYLNVNAVPAANEEAEFVKDALIEKKPKGAQFRQDRIWFRGNDHSIFNIQIIDKDSRIRGINVYRLDDRFSISEIVEATELRYEKEEWVLISGVRRRFHPDGEIETLPFETLPVNLDWRPEELRKIEIEPDNTTYTELASYVKRLETGGYSTGRYKVDLYEKLSFPFVNFIMALIGIAFGLRNSRGIGISKSIGVSMVIGFFYWIAHSIAMSLGYGGIIPPVLAAWTGILIFFTIGGCLFITTR
ncbi:MAG: LPS export ABC transporter permease LptG [Nitrospirota bacterium]